MNRFNQSRLNLFLLVIVCCAFATQYRTVGPTSPYTTLSAAVTSLLPLTEDAVIEVYVGENGLTAPLTVEATSDFNGHTITIQGVQAELSSATYYIGDEVEFNLDKSLNNETTQYIGDIARRVTSSTGVSSGNEYYVKNHLGSTMVMLDADGDEVLLVYDYFPYGKKIVELAGSGKAETHTFTGKELDNYDKAVQPNEDGEGWYYFGKRYYDADIGLWAGTDMLGQFWNLYLYSGGNPIAFLDPDGLQDVYFVDQSSRPADNGTSGQTYTAKVYVKLNDGSIMGPYKGSTYPNSINNSNNNTSSNTLTEGAHFYNNESGHKGKSEKGLNITDYGKRLTIGASGDEFVIMVNVNAHSGKSDKGNFNSRGSKGCLTIHPDDWADFTKNFDWSGRKGKTGNSFGYIYVQRGGTTPSAVTRYIVTPVSSVQDATRTK